MGKIFKKIVLWLVISILACIVIYLLSAVIFASLDVQEWNAVGRFLTGFIMAIAICITADEVSDLDLDLEE